MKRILAVCITLVLLLGAFPFTAHASDETVDAHSLYVTDGLKVQCLAYDNADVPPFSSWNGDVGSVNLIGNWEKNENGKGISYATKNAQFMGIDISPEFLGGGSYTIETVITPLGVIDNETGERKQGAVSHDLALQIGPFKAFGYPSLDGVDTSLALRYYYASTGGFSANGNTYATWNSFLAYDTTDVLNYTIRHTTDGKSSRYQILHDGIVSGVMEIGEEDYVPFELTDGRAQLFCYFPVNVYAVRVYNRALSDAERAQNHFADLLLYHRIDLSLFWNYLDEAEKTALMLSCADISFSDGAEVLGARISSYLYEKEAVGSESFRAIAQAYSLNLLPYLAAQDHAGVESAFSFVPLSGQSADAVQTFLDTLAAEENVIQKILFFAHFDSVSEETPEINAVFKADGELIRLLSEVYTVSYGALVGSADVYDSFDALCLTDEGRAPENAAVYYAEAGDENGFSYTVYWNEEHQNRSDYRHKVLFRGFVTLTDAAGVSETLYINAEETYDYYGNQKSITDLSMYTAARYFVSEYAGEYLAGYHYYHHPVLRDVLFLSGFNTPVRDEEFADADRLMALRASLKAGLDEALAVENVLFTDTSYPISGEKSIWVEYLADSVNSDARIRPAYIYFPMIANPTSKTEATLKAEGVYRVFCYIGMPEGNDTVPGLMCVHGGGGQAYIRYVQEAINHGYAAIAIDCDGETRSDPTAYDGSGYLPDYLGMAKDSLNGSERDIEEQWMYYVQRALIYANTVLRSLDRVDEDAVGITGISWGGLTTTIAIGYDDRYSFAVPVYLSGNMDESVGSWSSDFYKTGLWYNDEVLYDVDIPVLIINSDGDQYASLNTNALTYFDLPNAEMCIIHNYAHSQQHGASLSEIYAFGNSVTGYGTDYMPALKKTPSENDGRDYVLPFAPNSALTNYTATLYYLTEPVSYANGKMRVEWQSLALTIADGDIHVTVPEEACIYYVSFTAYSKEEDKMPTVYFEYDGILYGSTPLITIGSKGLYS